GRASGRRCRGSTTTISSPSRGWARGPTASASQILQDMSWRTTGSPSSRPATRPAPASSRPAGELGAGAPAPELGDAVLEGVAQLAVDDVAVEVDAERDGRLGDRRVDPGQDALGAEQADRLDHADQVAGGAGVDDLDAGEVEDGEAGPRGP